MRNVYVNLLVSIAFFGGLQNTIINKANSVDGVGCCRFWYWAIFERSGFISTIDSASEIDRNRISWLNYACDYVSHDFCCEMETLGCNFNLGVFDCGDKFVRLSRALDRLCCN